MEQRRYIRRILKTKTEISSGDKIFEGIIGNISTKGIHVRADAGKSKIEFNSGKIIALNFQPNQGKTLNLRCMIKWSNTIPTYGLTYDIGMEIIDSPFTNKEFDNTFK
jgi:hypothetical protein